MRMSLYRSTQKGPGIIFYTRGKPSVTYDLSILSIKYVYSFHTELRLKKIFKIKRHTSSQYFQNSALHQNKVFINVSSWPLCKIVLVKYLAPEKGAGTLVDVLQLSYSFHQNWSKLGTAITEDHKN
jgi:hypothetical protein